MWLTTLKCAEVTLGSREQSNARMVKNWYSQVIITIAVMPRAFLFKRMGNGRFLNFMLSQQTAGTVAYLIATQMFQKVYLKKVFIIKA